MDVGQTLGPLISSMIVVTFLGYMGLFSSLAIVLLFTVSAFAVSGIGKARPDVLP
jgi:hypothetical protein